MERPIGIFDSGVGGLTVAAAIKKVLPGESFIYFGDTQHAPYGDKSGETITRYSENITRFLLSQNCKAIVIACNSASAVAYSTLVQKFPQTVILNVIDPVVEFVATVTRGKVGIIATRATIQSGIYEKKLLQLNPKMEVVSAATPLLAPLIEEGFMHTDISQGAIREYLDDSKFNGLSTLILGCTHYPLIEREIQHFFGEKVSVVDSPELVARKLEKTLAEKNLKNPATVADYRFYLSEKTTAFSSVAKMFFGEGINLTEQRI